MGNFLTIFLFILSANYIVDQSVHAAESEYQMQKIDKAVELLKVACVTGGHSFQISGEGEGKFKVNGIFSNGVSGVVRLDKKSLGMASLTPRRST